MPKIAAALAVVVTLVGVAASNGQGLPHHVDPSAREDPPDLTLVPAIRFLTTGGFPPFNYRDADGEITGFNIDLARAICETVRAQCTIQSWPWDQAADALADNQGDALIAGLAISERTAAQFDFSNVYLALPARFVVRREREGAFDPKSPVTVAVRSGSAHQTYLERFFPAVTAVAFVSELDGLDAMRQGEVAGFFGDGMRASFWLEANPSCCRFWGEAYFDPDHFGPGLAIALPAGLDNVRLAVNWALSRLERDGKLDEIYLKWFPVGFY